MGRVINPTGCKINFEQTYILIFSSGPTKKASKPKEITSMVASIFCNQGRTQDLVVGAGPGGIFFIYTYILFIWFKTF